MKPTLTTFFFFLLFISCSEKNNGNKPEKPKAVLIKIGYYPSLDQPAETIINLNENYLIFYSQFSFPPIPPPPSKKDGEKLSVQEEVDYQELLDERPRLVPFKTDLKPIEINNLVKYSDSLQSDEFSDRNMKPANDGLSTNIIVLYSNGKLVQINPLNGPTEKQRKLYSEILNLLIEHNKNRSNKIILQKIKEYR